MGRMIDTQIVANDLNRPTSLCEVIRGEVEGGTLPATGLATKDDGNRPLRGFRPAEDVRLDCCLENGLVFSVGEAVGRRIESHYSAAI